MDVVFELTSDVIKFKFHLISHDLSSSPAIKVKFNLIYPAPSIKIEFEPVHEISNNVVCVTSKASDQPAHMRSLIRAFASGLSIL